MSNKITKLSLAVASALFLGASSAQAAMLLGFGAEADYFNPQVGGSMTYNGDLKTTTDFGGKNEGTYQFGAFFEHPVPIIPNLRVDYTPLKINAASTINANHGSFSTGVATNKIQLNTLDVTPYYEILDNIVSLDLGVTARIIDASIDTTQGANTNSENKSVVLPMGYIAAEVKLPLTGLRINADLKYLAAAGDKYMDSKAKISYDILGGLGVEAGYRYQALKLNHFNFDSDVTIKGPFVGMHYIF